MPTAFRHQLWRVALVLAVALIVVASPLWRMIQRGTQAALVPVVREFHRAGSYAGSLFRAHTTEQENERLRQELAAWQARNAAYEQLLQENEQLRELSGFQVPSGVDVVGAEVIGQEENETGRKYVVNRGAQDGVRSGLPLVAGLPGAVGSAAAMVLVGTITEVSERTSSFVPTTSPASQVLAQVVNDEHSQGLLRGEFNLGLRLTYLPPNDAVEVGDAVVTGNLDERVPSGILVGSITSVERIEGAFFQSATVVPPVPLERFRFLYILKRSGM